MDAIFRVLINMQFSCWIMVIRATNGCVAHKYTNMNPPPCLTGMKLTLLHVLQLPASSRDNLWHSVVRRVLGNVGKELHAEVMNGLFWSQKTAIWLAHKLVVCTLKFMK